MKRILLSLMAAALLSIAAFAPVAAQDTVTINMNEVDDSGQSGNANITSDGDQVIVSIEIEPGEEGVPQPAHIHEGSCADLGDVVYPLDDVVDGVSESTADVELIELLRGEYAINVHLSEDAMDVYVACGTLPLIGGAPAADDEEAAEEDDEEAVEDDDAVVEDDDAAAGEEDDPATDDAVVGADEEADDAPDLAPAAGSVSGGDSQPLFTLMLLIASTALGVGVLIRRRAVYQS